MPQQQQQQQSVPSHNGPLAGAGAPQQQQQQHQPGLGVKGPGPVGGGGGGGGYGGPGPAGDRPPQRQYVAVPTTGGRWVAARMLLGSNSGGNAVMIAVMHDHIVPACGSRRVRLWAAATGMAMQGCQFAEAS